MPQGRSSCRWMFVAWLALAGLATATPPPTRPDPANVASEANRRATAEQLQRDGNYREALELFRQLALDPGPDARRPADFENALDCYQRLNQLDQIDAFREQVAARHPQRFDVLAAVARSYLERTHDGFLVAGSFERGHHRGGGQYARAHERDRVRALQLYQQALQNADRAAPQARADLLLAFAQAVIDGRTHAYAWRLQLLTRLEQLPEIEPGYQGYDGGTRGAPVDGNSDPVLYRIPTSFAAAANDGERWRWLSQAAVESDPSRRDQVDFELAEFLAGQLGVQTLADYGFSWWRPPQDESEPDRRGSILALEDLGDDESIARLADGIHRFTLPAELNHVRIYQRLSETTGAYRVRGLERLAALYENRRQLDRAAAHWRSLTELAPSDANYRSRLAAIVQPWARFEPGRVQPAGTPATVALRSRNAKGAHLTARPVDIPRLLADVMAYLESNPAPFDHRRADLGDLGRRLLENNADDYLGKPVAAWDVAITPQPRHFDGVTELTTPLAAAGVYLLEARLDGGNTARRLVWLADAAIVQKPLDTGWLYFVADAVSGAPLGGAELERFGFTFDYLDRPVKGRHFDVHTHRERVQTDSDGMAVVATSNDHADQWLTIARTADGRLAFHGFGHTWHADWHDQEYQATRVFTLTSAPVYRPGQTVEYKLWTRHARYDVDGSSFAGKPIQVTIRNPRGEQVQQVTLTADGFGGIAGSLELAADAALGVWSLQSDDGGGSFRVEEYKKPEYEVTVQAPTEPVALGERIEATIEARYYFGAPVTEGTVHYKVLRETHSANWYPPSPWDWLYTPGYWWFAPDYLWYPGFQRWGCLAPVPPWWRRPSPPPELVAEAEVAIGADGIVRFTIDTTSAKLLHGDEDHRYTITAEVVDRSRRTVVGSGEVLVAREPFQVYVWPDRGHYATGDTVTASVAGRTLSGQPVTGTGRLELRQITYDPQRQPQETTVATWPLDTTADGTASHKLTVATPGQYRLVYSLTSSRGQTIEGGYVLSVRGAPRQQSWIEQMLAAIGFGPAPPDYRYNQLELIPDRRDYAVGDTVGLQVNSDRKDATVLLFARPANGVYRKPIVLRLQDRSHLQQLAVSRKDMPNLFVEAVSVQDAEVHTVVRELFVPPASRILDVAVEPSAEELLPGAAAEVTVTVRDEHGAPFQGALALAVYDKALEAIAGGSNVPDIRAFFWDWRRHHSPTTIDSLDRWLGNLLRDGERPMPNIGAFGDVLPEGAVAKNRTAGRMEADAMPLQALGYAADSSMAMEGGAPAPQARAASPAPSSPAGAAAAAAATPAPPVLRNQFADTALWAPNLVTDENGQALAQLTMPDDLTAWKVRAWAVGHGTRVGEASTEVRTRKNLVVRLQAPRFFIERDEVVLSANVHNYLTTAKQVEVVLELDGGTLEPFAGVEPRQVVAIPANGEARVDWRVRATAEGEAVVRMKGLTDEESDAVEMRFAVKVHGQYRQVAASGHLPIDQSELSLTIDVPAERRPDESWLELRWSPSLAMAMVDALPYLVSYPYGCTEQTVSRFVPTVLTHKVLLDLGVDLAAVAAARANLNAQELAFPGERAQRWKHQGAVDADGQPLANPVFDPDEVAAMVRVGIERLSSMQLGDGGWGWFSGWGERSSAHTTAYVVHGLILARANGSSVDTSMLDRGVQWLVRHRDEQLRQLLNAATKQRPFKDHADNLDAFVQMVLVEAGKPSPAMRDQLYRDRTGLAAYGLALFGLSLVDDAQAVEQLAMVRRNLDQYLRTDPTNQTAWLELGNGNYWWSWYGSEWEAHAYYLKILAATEPNAERGAWLVKYLLNNRKHATRWSSTRDTAITVEAMAAWLRASGEDKPAMTVEVLVDGTVLKTVDVDRSNLFTVDNTVRLDGTAVTTGQHRVTIRRRGRGPVYANLYLGYFSLEDPIPAAGLEIQVERAYYRLNRVAATAEVAGSRGQAVAQAVVKYQREAIPSDAILKSGDLIEVELTVTSKNDYEYIVLEDFKAAGLEPVDLRSGYTDNALGAYVEYRDDRAALFLTSLARGKHSVAYRLRAEIPGRFSALPAVGQAMYAPELRGNSEEHKLRIED